MFHASVEFNLCALLFFGALVEGNLRYSYDVIEGCVIYLEHFANSTSNFTQCAIRNARPIRMCERCVDYYLDVLKTHEDIYKVWRIKMSF
jgi:hypothetical protein